MTKFIIEVLSRGDESYLAVACPETALLSEAGVGGGDTERAAVTQAINSFYTRREQAAVATRVCVRDDQWSGASIQSAQVAVDEVGIRAMLARATEAQKPVRISGLKVNGDSYDRLVRPYTLRDSDDIVSVWDDAAGATRSFRIDGIERAVWVA